MTDPEKLRNLADWFDFKDDVHANRDQVQKDLRRIADDLESSIDTIKNVYLVWRSEPTRMILGCFANEEEARKYLGATNGFVESLPIAYL